MVASKLTWIFIGRPYDTHMRMEGAISVPAVLARSFLMGVSLSLSLFRRVLERKGEVEKGTFVRSRGEEEKKKKEKKECSSKIQGFRILIPTTSR